MEKRLINSAAPNAVFQIKEIVISDLKFEMCVWNDMRAIWVMPSDSSNAPSRSMLRKLDKSRYVCGRFSPCSRSLLFLLSGKA